MSHPIAPILDDMLSKADPDYKSKADIKWNFTKFLVAKNGVVWHVSSYREDKEHREAD